MNSGPSDLRIRLGRLKSSLVLKKNEFFSFVESLSYYRRKPRVFDLRIKQPQDFLIASHTYHNPVVVGFQLPLIRQLVQEPHDHIVFDNSMDDEKSDSIHKICAANDTSYVRLPENPARRLHGGYSHMFALNWVYRNFLLPSQYASFGFVDHDAFPIRPTQILKHLQGRPYWGLRHHRGEYWYLWPGVAFFDLDKIRNKRIDFGYHGSMDVGGANWLSLYQYDESEPAEPTPYACAAAVDLLAHPFEEWPRLMIPPTEYERRNPALLETDGLVEFFGDWIHFFNASNWRHGQDKSANIAAIMEKVVAATKDQGLHRQADIGSSS